MIKVGLDLDEVVVDICTELVETINTEFGLNLAVSVFEVYNFFSNEYTESQEVNKAIANRLVELVNDPGFISKAKPYDGVKDFLYHLTDESYRLHFITARPESMADITSLWLDQHGILYDELHVIGRKACKGRVGFELSLDIYVDDCPDNITAMLDRTNAKVFLVDKPWNRSYNNKQVIRLKDLKELRRYLNVTRSNQS